MSEKPYMYTFQHTNTHSSYNIMTFTWSSALKLTILFAHDPLSSVAYSMITYTHYVASYKNSLL